MLRQRNTTPEAQCFGCNNVSGLVPENDAVFHAQPVLLQMGCQKDVRERGQYGARIRNRNLKYDQAMNLRLINEFLVGREEKAFKYYHLQGAHVALSTNEYLENCDDTDKYRQLRGSLMILENLFFLLKENNLYDNATIVVTGDHTEDYQPEVATLVKAPGIVKDNMDYDDTSYVLADMPGIIQKLRGK